jgi:hypothetical protein
MKRSPPSLRSPLLRLILVVAAVLAASGAIRPSTDWDGRVARDVPAGGLSADVRVPGAIAPLPAAPVSFAGGSVRGPQNGPTVDLAGGHALLRPGSPRPWIAPPIPGSLHAGPLSARVHPHHLSGYRANAPPVTG